jgi:hypothetical protein
MILNEVWMPEDVVLSLFLDWCDLIEIVKFDTAICNRVDRAFFLSLLASKFFVLRRDYKWKNRSFVNWVIIKKVQFDNIRPVWLGFGDEDLISSLCLLNLSSVSTISLAIACKSKADLPFKSNTVGNFVNLCPNMTSLNINLDFGRLHQSPVCALFNSSILKQLLEIRLIGVNMFDSIALDRFSNLCSLLKKFDVAFDEVTDVTLVDLYNVVHRCKHLTFFATNYPVDEDLLSAMTTYLPCVEHVRFERNKTFSFDAVSKFLKAVGGRLIFFEFKLDDGELTYSQELHIGVASVGYTLSSWLEPNALNMSFVSLLTSLCVSCPRLDLYSLPVTEALLAHTVSTLNQVECLHICDCVLDSGTLCGFNTVFMQCKNLTELIVGHSRTLFRAKDLRVMFAQKTGLQSVTLQLGGAADRNYNVFRQALMHVVNGCPRLTKLVVIGKKKAYTAAFQVHLIDVSPNVIVENKLCYY